MATNNPYLNEPTKKDEDFGDKVIGTIDGVSSMGKTANAVGATMSVAGSVGTHAAVNAIPFAGATLSNVVGAKDLGSAVAGGFQESAKNVFNIGIVGQVMGVAVAGVGVVQAAMVFKDNKTESAKILAKTAVKALAVAGVVTGIALVPELAAKLFTGKSISDRVADAAESGVGQMMGEGKPQPPKIAETNGVTVPAATAVVAGGIGTAGLVANQVTGKNGQPITVGALPKAQGASVSLSGQPVIPSQVMPVSYSPQLALNQSQPAHIKRPQAFNNIVSTQPQPKDGMPEDFWVDHVNAQRQAGRVQGVQATPPTTAQMGVAYPSLSQVERLANRKVMEQQQPLTGVAV